MISSKKEKTCTQPCSTQPAVIAWWMNERIVKNYSQSQKQDGFSWIRKGVRRSPNVSMNEDTRKMHRAEVLGRKIWKVGKAASGRT